MSPIKLIFEICAQYAHRNKHPSAHNKTFLFLSYSVNFEENRGNFKQKDGYKILIKIISSQDRNLHFHIAPEIHRSTDFKLVGNRFVVCLSVGALGCGGGWHSNSGVARVIFMHTSKITLALGLRPTPSPRGHGKSCCPSDRNIMKALSGSGTGAVTV